MNQKKSPEEYIAQLASYILNIKSVIGLVLILIGVSAAISFMFLTYQIIVKTETIPLLESVLKIPQGEVEILSTSNGEALFVSKIVTYYFISFVFLVVGTGLSSRIIKIGVGLINKLDFKFLVQRLFTEWDKKKETKNSSDGVFRKKSNLK